MEDDDRYCMLLVSCFYVVKDFWFIYVFYIEFKELGGLFLVLGFLLKNNL